jgi:hypothetical protein
MIRDYRDEADALAALSGALADIGQFESAERVADKIKDSDKRVGALACLVRTLSDVGRFDDAERVAAKPRTPGKPSPALVSLAWTLADAGRMTDAARIAAATERSARGNLSHGWLARPLVGLADALSAAGLVKCDIADAELAPPWVGEESVAALAGALTDAGRLDAAEQVAAKIADPRKRARVLEDLIRALADAGLPARAERVADEAERAYADIDQDQGKLAWWLAGLARVLGNTGLRERAQRVAGHAERAAESAPDGYHRDSAFAALVSALAEAGRFEAAERVAAKIASPAKRATALAGLTQVLGTAGMPGQAAKAAEAARQAVGDITDAPEHTFMLHDLIRALSGAGLVDQAEQVARDGELIAGLLAEPRHQIGYFASRAGALTELVQAMAKAGLQARAERAAAGAEEAARNAEQAARNRVAGTRKAETLIGEEGLAALAKAFISVGLLDKAEQVLRAITPSKEAYEPFMELSLRLADVGEFEKAEYFGRKVWSDDPEKPSITLEGLVSRLADAGQIDWAERVARTITIPYWKAYALAKVVAALVAADATEEADRVTAEAEKATDKIVDPQHQSAALAEIIKNCERKDRKRWQQSAYRLCGITLTREYWTDVLPLMTRLNLPSLIAAINKTRSCDEI